MDAHLFGICVLPICHLAVRFIVNYARPLQVPRGPNKSTRLHVCNVPSALLAAFLSLPPDFLVPTSPLAMTLSSRQSNTVIYDDQGPALSIDYGAHWSRWYNLASNYGYYNGTCSWTYTSGDSFLFTFNGA